MSLAGDLVRLLPRRLEVALRSALGRPALVAEATGEKDASWYDRAFEEDTEYKAHYTESTYYTSWTVIGDRVRQAGLRRVLEVGCGPGQLACALRDLKLLDDYCGLDFAPSRIESARLACPQFRFETADAFTTPLFDVFQYDLVLTTEFLEHVEGDLKAIGRIRPGAHFLGTVPNYPYVSHVRHFTNEHEVLSRYGPYFDGFSVARIVRDARGHELFLMQGIRNIRRPPET